ncbi:proline transporter [Aspergillus sclerotioniger CBS 115572]|uniref:Proline transporter n=1 Tax=Aspergillus sclerotioniger CBS 115572 TaxID=1450535 RepID=A0A317V1R6_9EURO|nr:proline transporter [Aspergillus sclerotioniger CBS 115572]PWY67589.1 proline transporter [Aspergillus sclerotioniger CBS 115572]
MGKSLSIASVSRLSDDSSPPTEDGTVLEIPQTKRGLSSRHVQLMAIGGSIGTGLFVGIGSYLRDAGPLSLFLGYLCYGILFIWPTNLCVGEMCAYLPIRGSIFELAARYIDPAFGFAMGWVYFYGGLMLLCTEYAAVATVMQYWNTSINPAVWVAMAMIVCFLLNIIAVKYYGETEFIMASTKILLLIGLVLLTFITMLGDNPHHDTYGFRNWTHGLMFEYYTTGTTGRFLGWFSVVIYAAFSVAGPDLPALAAAEIENPRFTIPRVVKMTFYRIVGFYVIGVLAVSIICSPTDPRLLDALDPSATVAGSAASPWVIGIENLGIHGLPGFINFLILLAGWSCGNAYLYSASRTLYSLARHNQAPSFLLKCTASGVPISCVITVSLLSCITFLVADTSAITVFYWFVDLTTTAFILTYTAMVCVFLAWYRALKAQGIDRKNFLPWASPCQPYAAILALIIGSTVTLFNGFTVFSPFSVQGFITSYFGIAFWVVMFLFWKVWHKTKWVDPAKADIFSGKAEVDAECRVWEGGGFLERRRMELAGMHWTRRLWERMW